VVGRIVIALIAAAKIAVLLWIVGASGPLVGAGALGIASYILIAGALVR
jgi:hypothetical protein